MKLEKQDKKVHIDLSDELDVLKAFVVGTETVPTRRSQSKARRLVKKPVKYMMADYVLDELFDVELLKTGRYRLPETINYKDIKKALAQLKVVYDKLGSKITRQKMKDFIAEVKKDGSSTN